MAEKRTKEPYGHISTANPGGSGGYPDATLALFHGPRRLAVYDADGTPKEDDEKRAA